MKVQVIFILSLLITSSQIFGQQTFAIYSPEVGDSFNIHIDKGPMDTAKPIRYVYYLDAGIKSGAEIRRQMKTMSSLMLQNKVFVGIAHIGNFHTKRRRDFIPPNVDSGSGRADLFYQFLTERLFTQVESIYGPKSSRSIVGHSFGGLFVFYTLFRADRVFDKYFALSPSLWMNKYAVFDQEEAFHVKAHTLPVFLYLSAGTAETFNYILAGNRRMKQLLDQRGYEGLRFAYEEHPGKTHNSQVPKSVALLLNIPD